MVALRSSILITGCSTGIGFYLAKGLALKGFDVWATARRIKDIESLQAENIHIRELDVTSEASIQKLFAEMTQQPLKKLSLINNAGLAIVGPLETLDIEEWHRQFEVNFFAVVRMTQIFLPLIRATGGRVVNMSSIAGRIASPYLGAYVASKFAVEGMSDSLRRELAPQGVRVILIEPGAIRTPIWEKSRQIGHQLVDNLTPEMEALYGKKIRKFEQVVMTIAENAAPVEWVVDAVEKAVSAKKPKTRYLVGKGVFFQALLARLLPDYIMDRFFVRTAIRN